jgi:predicted DsbA family dithiol-disulfide isomerase
MSMTDSTRPVRVDVWSDPQCIWCYISSARLAAAVEQHPGSVEVVHHSFQLSPDAEVDIDREAQIRGHRMDPEQMRQIGEQLRRLIAEGGLPYDPDRTRPTNSHLALELLHHAASRGRREELTRRLYEAYFAEGRHIGRAEELVALAVESGIDPAEATAVLADRRHAAAVDDDMRRAQQLGARGVPFYVIDDTWGLSGAQPVEQFLTVFAEAAQQ